MWQLLDELRGERRTGRSARMLFEVLGDIWVVDRNPYLQDDLLDNPKRQALLVEALRHRLREIEKRRQAGAGGGRRRATRKVAQLVAAANAPSTASRVVSRHARTAQARARACSRGTRDKDNIAFDGLARVSHVTDATDWRVEYPFVVLYPDTEDEVRGLVEGCIELGLTIIPRGGGTGYTGGAIPLDARSAVINTEKLERLSAVERIALPGHTQADRDDRRGRGRGHAARDGGGRSARVSSLRGSDVGRRVVHRRQRRDERRRQEGGAVGHGARQSGVVADGHAGGASGWRSSAPTTTSARSTTPRRRRSSARGSRRDGKTRRAHARRWRFPARAFRKAGLGKDVTDKFLAGLPGIQKEGCDGIITSARFILHTMPPAIRTVCLEFFGQVRDSTPAIVEIKDYLDALPKAGGARVCWPGSSISTSAM